MFLSLPFKLKLYLTFASPLEILLLLRLLLPVNDVIAVDITEAALAHLFRN